MLVLSKEQLRVLSDSFMKRFRERLIRDLAFNYATEDSFDPVTEIMLINSLKELENDFLYTDHIANLAEDNLLQGFPVMLAKQEYRAVIGKHVTEHGKYNAAIDFIVSFVDHGDKK